MEHESFEDSVVAVKMNANYVPIKIDREERPDIDQIYMNAAYLISGRGGWPLNAIALPDGRPVYAGTYFPRDRWIAVLDYFAELYRDNAAKLEEQAEKLTEGIQGMDALPFKADQEVFTRDMLDHIWAEWEDRIDYKFGGRQGAPKFMMPNNWEFLLRYYAETGKPRVKEAIEVTLEKMAFGGLYDHVGGGFARYSTDAEWLVPHFEKMLYDNGQLVSVYSQAYQLTGDNLYKSVVAETLEFISREMTDASGGFYASLDADSEGEEGKFYVWTEAELRELLGRDFGWFKEYYSISEAGNWEDGKNILFRTRRDTEFLSKQGWDAAELDKKRTDAKALLLAERSKRVRPGLDDKILTSWNALMLKGYVDAYRAFGEPSWLEAARRNADFIIAKCLREDGGLNRNYKEGRSTINGFLDDYSLTIEAFIALYQASFEEKWLQRSRQLADYVIAHFLDEKSGVFYYTSDEDPRLISRTRELSDNVISSSNSSMARGLFYLGHYYYNDDYIERARQMLNNMSGEVLKNGPFYANWATMMTHFVYPPYEVAILGDACSDVRADFDKHYLPRVLFLGSSDDPEESSLQLLRNKMVDGQTTIYVCVDKTCRLPVTRVDEALKLMK